MNSMNRRHLLQAAGLSLSLPWFESLAGAGEKAPPKRFCNIFFPFGASTANGTRFPDELQWNWYPTGEGKDFKFRKSLEHLEPMRQHVTVIKGLHHPNGTKMGGHDTADIFLTGALVSRSTGLKNTVSLDQYMARTHRLGMPTRFTSLVLANEGGAGTPLRRKTMSFDARGTAVPSIGTPALVFERLFGSKPGSIEAQRKGLARTGSHLDLLTKQANSLNGKLNAADKRKLDQYLTSVRAVEKDVERAASWLDIPKPKVSAEGLALEADSSSLDEMIRTMLDIIVLAFQTDSTRFVTYQFGHTAGAASKFNSLPQLLKLKVTTIHGMNHGINKKEGCGVAWGQWDQYLAKHLHYFLNKLSEIPEANGSLLDNTCVLYGSNNHYSHSSSQLPILLAGGKSMGFKHGQFLTYGKDVPLSNLFVTIMKRMGVKANRFADSNGELSEV